MPVATGGGEGLPAAVAHWKDAGHDWLLSVDAMADELVVYDAADGRPLRRLGAADGLAGIEAMTPQGARLLIFSRRYPQGRWLQLPQLRWVSDAR